MSERAGGAALKRRGLIAGAAALVAGLVAKRAAEDAPVAANDATWTFPYVGVASSASEAFYVSNGGGVAIYGISSANDAIFGSGPSISGRAGVIGSGGGSATTGGSTYGVLGTNIGTGVGVKGVNNGAGGTGVRGESASGFPIVGNVSGIASTSAGVLGAGTVGPGVQGQSLAGHGLVGTTGATDGHAGLIGNATAAGGIGLMGVAPGFGTTSVGRAAVFYGNVHIQGVFTAPQMQTLARHPTDGTYRALQGVVAPEGWVEDFGAGTLAGGKAEVRLDAEFAALVHADKYHVFLTEYEGHSGLYVTNVSASGFTVQAGAAAVGGLKAPTKAGGGTFSYRVVAKRKDVAAGRLAKVAGPPSAPTEAMAVAPFAIPASPPDERPVKQP